MILNTNCLTRKLLLAIVVCLGITPGSFAQTDNAITFQDLSAFKSPGKTWQIAGDVEASLEKDNILKPTKGTGILVNLPDKKNHGADLYTTAEYGDAELELDYMLAKNSNSGVYLQGRYEIQLMDSWSRKSVNAGDNGGIYERWDDSKPEGQKGYQGYAPRQNASRAPGLWQHLKVAFKAPTFDGSGRKTANARIVRLELNGVIIHDGVELLGPTRGAMANDEKATGPLRFQGDHGAVAFRNITITNGVKMAPEPANANVPDPILVEAPVTTVLRSFMDLPDQSRVVHAVNVGSPEKVHYTYDLDQGNMIQMWRGNFLDATPMWHERGDGSSRPAGAVCRFGKPVFSLAKLATAQSAWATDTVGSGYRPKGYTLDENDCPTFVYQVYGAKVSDAIRVLENGQGLRREITVQNPAANLYAKLAEGSNIEEKEKGWYLVDGKAYYLQVTNVGGTKPVIRDTNGRKELIVPMKEKLVYSMLF
ncbi:DUF1080 domain-containing protein [uncultured Hymenobacter sp.]|uniref:3-keto-disaccharide hydrolase n=1 Tax=uncultured Hymenobacter sp. TaxID=170016 RepID=UPI0035C965DD